MKRFLIVVTALFLLSGCGTVPYRTGPSFETYFDSSKTVSVLPPDMKMYQLTAGNVDEYNVEWSEKSKAIVERRLKEEVERLKGVRPVEFGDVSLNSQAEDILDRQTGMFYTVADSVIVHTYFPEMIIKHKVKNFDYTLGEEVSALKDISPADTYLFCSGKNYIWTAGRATLAAFNFLAAAAVGVPVVIGPGNEYIALSLVDGNSGEIVWFNYQAVPGDMRKPEVVDRVVKRLFRQFPEKWRKEGYDD